MSWIERIPYERATGRLRAIYDRIKGPRGELDNILTVHSLRPHTLEGHMALYKSVLHHTGNQLPTWWLETIGVYVSGLNRCDYCVDHHFAGLRRLLADVDRAAAIRAALDADDLAGFEPREQAMLAYARQLTLDPSSVTEADLERMRVAGLSDGEMLEVNQVAAYFAYANRTVSGLGVTTAGDVLGLAPADTSGDDWGHG
ncbi:MAG: peroxidase-related enzyme [Chloroflexi bacterium]|nr:peroxidase-related enzyme [Chloroflexota bacterium]